MQLLICSIFCAFYRLLNVIGNTISLPFQHSRVSIYLLINFSDVFWRHTPIFFTLNRQNSSLDKQFAFKNPHFFTSQINHSNWSHPWDAEIIPFAVLPKLPSILIHKRLYGAHFTNSALHLAVFILQISLGSCSFNNFFIFSNIFLNAISIRRDILKGQAHDLNVLTTLKKSLTTMMLYLVFIFPTLFVLPVYLKIKVKFLPELLSPTAPPKT